MEHVRGGYALEAKKNLENQTINFNILLPRLMRTIAGDPSVLSMHEDNIRKARSQALGCVLVIERPENNVRVEPDHTQFSPEWQPKFAKVVEQHRSIIKFLHHIDSEPQ